MPPQKEDQPKMEARDAAPPENKEDEITGKEINVIDGLHFARARYLRSFIKEKEKLLQVIVPTYVKHDLASYEYGAINHDIFLT